MRVFIQDFSWYLPHCTPKRPSNAIISRHDISEAPTELRYTNWSVSPKKVNVQWNWFLETGKESGNNFLIDVIKRTQQKIR